MPVDPVLAALFGANPRTFLDSYYFKVRNQASLRAVSTWLTLGGGAVQDRLHGGAGGTLALGAMNMVADDCLIIDQIGGRTPPSCFVGFDAVHGKPKYLNAEVVPNAAHGYVEVLYLPARANQITAILLPAAGGPSVVLTDPLTGCTVYTGTFNGVQAMCHANAYAVLAASSDQHMKNLKNQLAAGGVGTGGHAFVKTGSLKKDAYRQDIQNLQARARADKVNMGRTVVTAHGNWYTTIVGIRSGATWDFFSQSYSNVQSTRTGLKVLFMGRNSNKARIAVAPF